MNKLPPQDRSFDTASYPDPAVEALDRQFESIRLLPASLERLWKGGRWTEGPVWFGDGRFLLFSDIPNQRILRWAEETGEVSVFRSPSGSANGNTRDRSGRLLTCEQDGRRVTRTEIDGSITVLIDSFEGKRLNSPNDIVVHPDGHVWFSDPGYGILSNYEGNVAEAELPTRIYRLDPVSRRATVVTEELTRPNGLCFSPDCKRLFAVDTGCTDNPGHHRNIMVFDISPDMRLFRGKPFCDMSPGRSDGIRCDSAGNLWAASGFGGPGTNGVLVFSPIGKLIGRIHLPEPCSNLCFGGLKRNRLFMTGSQSLYSLYVEAQGVPYA